MASHFAFVSGTQSEDLEDLQDPEADGDLPMVWERPAEPDKPVDRLPEARLAYRKHQRMMGAAAIPLMIFLVPTMQIIFLIVVWVITHSDDTIRTVAPILGMLASVAIVAGLANWLALLGNRRFEREMRAVLRERFGREGGELVAMSRLGGRTFMQQQMEGHSDVGVLYEDEDALVFEGIRERHVIKHADIVGVQLAANWQFIQFAARWCVVRYRLRDGEVTHDTELRFVSRRERSIRRNVHATRAMSERLGSALGATA